MSNRSTAGRPGIDLSPAWTLLGAGIRALFAAFFLGLWLTVVYNAAAEGRIVDATVGASVFAVPLVLAGLWVKRHLLG